MDVVWCVVAVCMFMFFVMNVMWSASVLSYMCLGGVGMSEVYLYVICNNLIVVMFGMFVCISLLMSVYIFNVYINEYMFMLNT